VFKIWNEGDILFQVKIDPETNALVWSDTTDQTPSLPVPRRAIDATREKQISFRQTEKPRPHPRNRWAHQKQKGASPEHPSALGRK
jgi:hypothetical protein